MHAFSVSRDDTPPVQSSDSISVALAGRLVPVRVIDSMDAPSLQPGAVPRGRIPNARDLCLRCNHNSRREMRPLPYPCGTCGQPCSDQGDLLFTESWLGSMRSKFFERLASGKEKNVVSVEVDNVPLPLLFEFFDKSFAYGRGIRLTVGSAEDVSWDHQPRTYQYKQQSSAVTEKHAWCLTLWDQLSSLFAFDTLPQPRQGIASH